VGTNRKLSEVVGRREKCKVERRRRVCQQEMSDGTDERAEEKDANPILVKERSHRPRRT